MSFASAIAELKASLDAGNDALTTKHFRLLIEAIEALNDAAFYADGSKPMSGDLNMNENSINDAVLLNAQAIVLTGTTPYVRFWESDQAADSRNWRFRVGGGQFSLQAENDAGDSESIVFSINRSGLTLGNLELFTTLDLNGNDLVGVDDLVLESTNPSIDFVDTDGGTDGKRWRIGTDNDNLIVAMRDDANSNIQSAAVFRRTGATLDHFDLLTDLDMNGNSVINDT